MHNLTPEEAVTMNQQISRAVDGLSRGFVQLTYAGNLAADAIQNFASNPTFQMLVRYEQRKERNRRRYIRRYQRGRK